MTIKRLAALILAAAFLAILPMPNALSEASASDGARTDGLGVDVLIDPPPLDYDFSTIRVLLTTNDNTDIEFDLTTDYYVEGTLLHGTAASPFKLRIKKSGSLVKLYNKTTGDVIASGSQVYMSRADQDYTLGYAKLTKCSGAKILNFMYLGNFTFMLSSTGYVNVVNTVPMAYFIYGALANEIGSSSPVAALKAQAIAIKTFSMYYIRTPDAAHYDVQDGYKSKYYQKYRGYQPAYENTMEQCLDVIGEALALGDSIFATVYANSNGGETHVPSYAGLGSSFNAAYPVMLDDHELNGFSGDTNVIHIDIDGLSDSSRFHDFILYKMLSLYGVSATSVVSIKEFSLSDPIPGTQRHYQMMHVKAKVSTSSGNVTKSFDCPTEELNDLDISDMDGSGDSYSSYPNMLKHSRLCFFTRTAASGGIDFICSGSGHGVGLSQQGAIVLARDHGFNYRRILEYYYPLFRRITIAERPPETAFSGEYVPPVTPTDEPTAPPTAQPTASPSATPEPSPMPIESDFPVTPITPGRDDTVAYGIVTGYTVYFREGPSADTPHIAVAHRNDHLDILGVTDNGWFHAVLRGQYEGYITMNHSQIIMFPSPPDGVFMLVDGETIMGANLRSEPRIKDGNVAAYLQRGTELTAWARIGKWYYIITEDGEHQGFIHMDVVSMEAVYYYIGVSKVSIKNHALSLEPQPPDDGRRKLIPEG